MSLTPCEAGQELRRICSMAPVVPVLVIDDATRKKSKSVIVARFFEPESSNADLSSIE